MDSITRIAAGIVAKADRQHPADALLRTELKAAKGLSRGDARRVSKEVFAYFRWLGWMEPRKVLEHQIQDAVELNDAFQRNPGSIPETELIRAVPEWTESVMEISIDWLKSLQVEPRLWLRARPGQGMSLAERLGSTHGGGGALVDSLIYEGEEDLYRTPEFQGGEFELQDVSSQIVGLVCDPKPGCSWWDACAGEGGKMLHLCDLLTFA
jgi:16S rRNA (cytosine967-C5)-methyltransferase